jgi:hypothetical protein
MRTLRLVSPGPAVGVRTIKPRRAGVTLESPRAPADAARELRLRRARLELRRVGFVDVAPSRPKSSRPGSGRPLDGGPESWGRPRAPTSPRCGGPRCSRSCGQDPATRGGRPLSGLPPGDPQSGNREGLRVGGPAEGRIAAGSRPAHPAVAARDPGAGGEAIGGIHRARLVGGGVRVRRSPGARPRAPGQCVGRPSEAREVRQLGGERRERLGCATMCAARWPATWDGVPPKIAGTLSPAGRAHVSRRRGHERRRRSQWYRDIGVMG